MAVLFQQFNCRLKENISSKITLISGLIFMLGDTMFNYPIDRMVKLHGNKAFNILNPFFTAKNRFHILLVRV